jgi:aspartate kinase
MAIMELRPRIIEQQPIQQKVTEPVVVMKFGGTSVGGARPIEQVSRIVENHYHQETKKIVVVVSAMRGITDSLIRAASLASNRRFQDLDLALWDIVYKHQEEVSKMDLSPRLHNRLHGELESLFSHLFSDARHVAPTELEFRDQIISYGERLNSRIVAARIDQQGIPSEAVDATEIIETNNQFGDAKPDMIRTAVYADRKITPMIEQKIIPVVTGFIGATKDNKTTTLGRGGSDYTASILGRVLSANEVWIWTDVDGIYSDDPRKNPDAQILTELSYQKADEMAKAGAKVLYEKTVEPLLDTDITLRVKNTFRPHFIGTRISSSIE